MKNFKFIVSICAIGVAAVGHTITIADAKALGDGQAVTLDTAVITSATDLINSGSFMNFQLQDATGAITVFGSNDDINAVFDRTECWRQHEPERNHRFLQRPVPTAIRVHR